MNFEQIKKKYPKAWKKFIEFYAPYENLYPLLDKMAFKSLSGWLFKFFDKQGIRPYIIPFGYDILDEYFYVLYQFFDKEEKMTRNELEQAAFTKAFKILEGKDGDIDIAILDACGFQPEKYEELIKKLQTRIKELKAENSVIMEQNEAMNKSCVRYEKAIEKEIKLWKSKWDEYNKPNVEIPNSIIFTNDLIKRLQKTVEEK